ncbi:MAG: DUF5318 family protein [Acidimicrobiia bacterium]
MGPQVDYVLARKRVLNDFKHGALTRLDVCDAHPELVRAADNVGEPADFECPICGEHNMRWVQYVYGDGLRAANGRAISMPGELAKLGAQHDEFHCYEVEVCLDCHWNFLGRRITRGKRHAG